MSLFKKKTADVQEPMDLDAVMKKYDRESNTRVWEGTPKLIVTIILASFSVFCLYVTLFATWLDELRLTSFMAFIMLIGYIVFPAKKGVQKVNHMPWYDVIIMLLGTGAFLYFTFNATAIVQRFNINTVEVVIGIVGVLALAELCRRSVGIPILIVAGALLVYALVWGSTNPNIMSRITETVRVLFYSKEGILSTPVNVCSKYIVVFIIFGAFLERTGIADFFINIANALVGRFSGGPAKVAVVASALEGMVSGSSVANTVGSGAVTIPLMKKTGYKPEFAAAAEASASTGGQIMPPIMGAAAFLMAETIGVPYSSIALRAILPAVLYFAGVFITVHLEAKKEGLRGLTKDELPALKPLLKQLYLLLPLVVLIYLVGSNTRSIQYAAAIAIVFAIVVSLFNKEHRITPKRLLEALAAGGQGMITVAVACGVAGIVAGVIGVTGLAYMLFNGIVALAGNHLIVALFLTMLCCIVLGMGVPTTANYCIMAATCAPILVRMGVPDIAAQSDENCYDCNQTCNCSFYRPLCLCIEPGHAVYRHRCVRSRHDLYFLSRRYFCSLCRIGRLLPAPHAVVSENRLRCRRSASDLPGYRHRPDRPLACRSNRSVPVPHKKECSRECVIMTNRMQPHMRLHPLFFIAVSDQFCDILNKTLRILPAKARVRD